MGERHRRKSLRTHPSADIPSHRPRDKHAHTQLSPKHGQECWLTSLRMEWGSGRVASAAGVDDGRAFHSSQPVSAVFRFVRLSSRRRVIYG